VRIFRGLGGASPKNSTTGGQAKKFHYSGYGFFAASAALPQKIPLQGVRIFRRRPPRERLFLPRSANEEGRHGVHRRSDKNHTLSICRSIATRFKASGGEAAESARNARAIGAAHTAQHCRLRRRRGRRKPSSDAFPCRLRRRRGRRKPLAPGIQSTRA
jgi:hypothetical protein